MIQVKTKDLFYDVLHLAVRVLPSNVIVLDEKIRLASLKNLTYYCTVGDALPAV